MQTVYPGSTAYPTLFGFIIMPIMLPIVLLCFPPFSLIPIAYFAAFIVFYYYYYYKKSKVELENVV